MFCFRSQNRTMQKCGFCSMLSGLLRRATCISSRRGSSESYYRELGDQDTLKIEDKSSMQSDDSGEILQDIQVQVTEAVVTGFEMRRRVCTGRFLTMHKRRKKRLVTRSLCREAGLLDDLHLGQVQCILRQSVMWKFNAFTLENVSGGRCLPVLCVHLFHIYGLISYFKLDVVRAWKLFSLIEEGYHSTNPYHNSVHAADVTQAMHCFLQQKQILAYLEPLEILASLLAAIAHDMDHPGVNQPFLIATSNHLAALYQNTSVLENHHWRSAISCIIESGLLESQEMFTQLERQISSLILATDITRQQEFLSQFKTHLDTNTLDMRKSEHRHLVLQIALKCADISNPCRPWEISRKWSLKVCEEFFRQGDYERKLNLPVTALCDRHTTSIPKIQAGFFKFVVTPLITEWHRFLRNDLSTQMLDNLLYNQNKWETLVAQELAEETRTEISDADLVDDDVETGTESSELLLPLRRGSLNSAKPIGLKEQLRRFSVPLNVFQDARFKAKNKSRESSSHKEVATPTGSELSIHSQLSVGGHCNLDEAEKLISTEKLLPDCSIASITTPMQATRLNTVIKQGSWKLVRQQTFPPLETPSRSQSLHCRPLYMSNEDAIYPPRCRTDLALTSETERMERNSFWRNETHKTENDDSSENSNVDVACARYKENWNLPTGRLGRGRRRESLPVGTQLRDNLSAVQLDASDQRLRRRKSMPSDTVYTPKEKKMREVAAALPQLLRRTLSGKDAWSRRRGSAPAPVAPSELRGLASLGALRHSMNGGRRRQSPMMTCQQWLAKTTQNVQDTMRTFQQLQRRSSLPAEVITVPRARVVSHSQVETLLSLLEDNPRIARGSVGTGALASQRVDEFWRNAATTLNCLGDGATKTPKQWKTYWHELRYRARKRNSLIRQHARGTGGGPGIKPHTARETRILELVGEVSYAGNSEVQIPVPHLQNPGPSAAARSPPSPLPLSPISSNLQELLPPEQFADSFSILQNAGPLSISPSPLFQLAGSSHLPSATSPPPPPVDSSTDDSVEVGPRRGRTAAEARSRPYQRRRYDDPPVWAQRYEEQRLEIDRDRARQLRRLVEIAEQALELLRTHLT